MVNLEGKRGRVTFRLLSLHLSSKGKAKAKKEEINYSQPPCLSLSHAVCQGDICLANTQDEQGMFILEILFSLS
jgi:hypothetical protein